MNENDNEAGDKIKKREKKRKGKEKRRIIELSSSYVVREIHGVSFSFHGGRDEGHTKREREKNKKWGLTKKKKKREIKKWKKKKVYKKKKKMIKHENDF